MVEHFYPREQLGQGRQAAGGSPLNMVNVPRAEKPPGMGSILGAALGKGLGEGIQSSMKQMMNKKAIDRALGNLPDNATPKQIMQAIGGENTEVQKAFIDLYHPARAEEAATARSAATNQTSAMNKMLGLQQGEQKMQQEAQLSQEKEMGLNRRAAQTSLDRRSNSFVKLVDKDDSLAGKEAADVKNDTLQFGSKLLEQGVPAATAFNQAKQIAKEKNNDKQKLKNLKGPHTIWSRGGESGSIRQVDKKSVSEIRKNKLLDDDEIITKLLDSGYTPDQVQNGFKLKPSFALLQSLKNLGTQFPQQQQSEQEQQQPQRQPQQQQQISLGSKGEPSDEYIDEVLRRAGNDSEKAMEIARSEGYSIP